MVLKKIGHVLGTRDKRLAGAIDVELRGDVDVKYDVARRRLVSAGASIARGELRQAIVRGLSDLGIADRLDAAAKIALEALSVSERDPRVPKPVKPLENEEILQAVLGELPSGEWPPGLHHLIAERLNIRPSLCYRAISTLLESGRITKPKRDER
jgi:hypothetical protein